MTSSLFSLFQTGTWVIVVIARPGHLHRVLDSQEHRVLRHPPQPLVSSRGKGVAHDCPALAGQPSPKPSQLLHQQLHAPAQLTHHGYQLLGFKDSSEFIFSKEHTSFNFAPTMSNLSTISSLVFTSRKLFATSSNSVKATTTLSVLVFPLLP